jgi:hypothetical protein
MRSYLEMVTMFFFFFETKFVIKTQRRYIPQYVKYPLEIILSEVGYSSFKRLVTFCTEKEREDRELRRKMLIESRKRLLEAHKISTS